MFEILSKMFRAASSESLEPLIAEIASFEAEIASLTNENLRAASLELRKKIQEEGLSLEEALPRAFALAREAAKRTLGQRPYDEQLMGGVVLFRGGVSEMMTGEGKTLSAVAPAYLRALAGKGVHVITVNEYLARRDAVWMGQVYRALGLSVACLVPNQAYLYDPEWKIPEEGSELIDRERDQTGNFIVQQEFLKPLTRREAYLADITYGTNHEFGFDYLRDNLTYALTDQVQRKHYYAIIDEVDSILIDEARTPLIISAPDEASSDFYKTFAKIAERLTPEDYLIDEKLRTVQILEPGIEKVEKSLGVQNIYAPENIRLVHYLEESLRAQTLYHKDKDYVVKNGEIIIVDEFTGRLLQGRRYNGGLHQAIEAKEGVYVKEESRTYAKISIQNYFRLYEKIAGMTGTAQTSAEEFHKVYGLDVVSIKPHRPVARIDMPDKIYKNAKAKWAAVVEDVREHYEKGQPVLLGTTSIEKNEHLSALLHAAHIPHEVLNAKNNEREGAIIAQAGRVKAVTVATNMAGRGVDIILGGNPVTPEEAAKVRELGGLHVIGTERHDARRIDNQLRGRSGRQGDPGSSQFFLSLEDDLMRIFGGERIRNMMDRFDLPDNQPIDLSIVSRAVQQAQAKVEGANFDARKHLIEYDDVLNKQRASVYSRRQKILESVFLTGELPSILFDAVWGHFEEWQKTQEAGMEGEWLTKAKIKNHFEEAGLVSKDFAWPLGDKLDEPISEEELVQVKDFVTKRVVQAASNPLAYRQAVGILDMLWMGNLENLDALNESVRLRAYAQKDPLVEYRQESRRLFNDFWSNWSGWLFGNIFKLPTGVESSAPASAVPKAATPPPVGADGEKIGRNDLCYCGSGKKFKKCHGA